MKYPFCWKTTFRLVHEIQSNLKIYEALNTFFDHIRTIHDFSWEYGILRPLEFQPIALFANVQEGAQRKGYAGSGGQETSREAETVASWSESTASWWLMTGTFTSKKSELFSVFIIADPISKLKQLAKSAWWVVWWPKSVIKGGWDIPCEWRIAGDNYCTSHLGDCPASHLTDDSLFSLMIYLSKHVNFPQLDDFPATK